jgi:hypothetical protein
VVVGSHRHQVVTAVPQHAQPVDRGDAVTHPVGVLERLACERQVAVDTEVLHHRPGRSHRQAGARALQVG